MGGDRRVRGRSGRPQAGHYSHLDTAGGYTEETAVARESFNEAGYVVPATGPAGGRLSSDIKRARAQTPPRQKRILEAGAEDLELDRGARG